MPADDALRLQRRMRTAFVLAVALLAVFVIWTAADFRRAARLFPIYAGWITLGLCAIELARQAIARFWRARRAAAPTAVPPTDPDSTPDTADIGLDAEDMGLDGLRRGLGIFAWLLGYGVLIVLLGMPWATVLFVPLLLHLRFHSDWRATVGIVLGLLALMWLLRTYLMLRLPPGLLDLPLLP